MSTSRVVAVEHIRVHTARPFAEVVRWIEAETGVFDAAALQAPPPATCWEPSPRWRVAAG